jgi:cytochrome c peroxidase
VRNCVALALALVPVACDPPVPRLCAPTLPATLYGYSDLDAPIPPHFLSSSAGTVRFTDNTSPTNPITNAGATLGRVLFHDVRLSVDLRVACASCHRQTFGFGDTVQFSPGFRGRHLARKTMALANARFNPSGRFFWDERAPTLEIQVLQPIQDRREMAMPLETLERRLAGTPFYPPLFAAAFGSPEVTRDRIALALAQFVRSLVSAGSRFDAVFATGGAPDTLQLRESERHGLRVFVAAGCVNCHRTIAHVADRANNIGLDSLPADSGAGQGRFKPPSLRNIAVRPPYMHDGRFSTLREVVEFYDQGVLDGPQLDPRLRAPDGSPKRLRLSRVDIDALIAFLEALTDSVFLAADQFTDPFRCSEQSHAPGRPPSSAP